MPWCKQRLATWNLFFRLRQQRSLPPHNSAICTYTKVKRWRGEESWFFKCVGAQHIRFFICALRCQDSICFRCTVMRAVPWYRYKLLYYYYYYYSIKKCHIIDDVVHDVYPLSYDTSPFCQALLHHQPSSMWQEEHYSVNQSCYT